MPDVSTLLNDKASGVQDSADRLFRLLYDELRNIAGAQLQHVGGRRVLGTTTLVHESYLRFIKKGELAPEDRDHFLAYASHVMRSIVVDAARRQLASKRGAGQPHVMLSDEAIANVTASACTRPWRSWQSWSLAWQKSSRCVISADWKKKRLLTCLRSACAPYNVTGKKPGHFFPPH